MRNRALAAAAALMLSMVQLACSGETASSEDATGASESTAAPPPSHDLESANVGGEANGSPMARTGAATAYGSANTDVQVGGDAPVDPGGDPAEPGSGTPAPTPSNPGSGAGPKPTGTCSVTKDAQGFFTLSSSKSSYVAYVPASYNGSAPMRLIVGLHGCGDSAKNFAAWGVNPADTRATQQHIGISIGGRDGACWTMGTDDDKVLAAVDHISQCFWVHQKKVAVAGFSSGGQLAYRVGLKQASRFAAILIENSGLYAADSNADALLANASWKVNIAHRTHASDTVFPLAKVQADWAKTTAAGFPLLTSVTPGGHDGVSADWATWLIPQSASWVAP